MQKTVNILQNAINTYIQTANQFHYKFIYNIYYIYLNSNTERCT